MKTSLKTHTCWFSLLIGAFIGLSSPVVLAENLQQAWAVAIAQDHALKAARQNTLASQEMVIAAHSARYPVVDLSAGYTALENAPASKVQFGPTPTQMTVGEDRVLSYGAQVTLPLYTSGKISSAIDMANQQLTATKMDESVNLQSLKLTVAKAYIQVQRAQMAVELVADQVASLQANLKDVQNMYDESLVDRNDLLAAKVALVDAKQQALQASNGLDLAKSSYNRLLGRPLDAQVSLDQLPLTQAPKKSIDQLTDLALSQRDELKGLQANQQALKAKVSQVSAEAGPQISLSAGYAYQQNKYQVHPGNFSATLGAKWRIFDAGITKHQADQAQRQANSLQETLRNLQTQIALQVRQAWLTAAETNKRIAVTKVAISQAEENLKVTRERYLSGLSKNTEVLDATTLKTRSENNYYNALYDAILATIQLKRVTGTL